MAGIAEADAAQAMRDYVGVVFDIGHQSVGFEDIPTSLQKLVDAGIKITKLQEAASMSMPHVTKETIDALQAFAKTMYLSQTCQMKDGKTQWFLNLEDAFEDFYKDPGAARVAHALPRAGVPDRPGPRFRTTRFALEQALAVPQEEPDLSTHLEIETYTWDVLPRPPRRPATSSNT